MGAGLAIAQLIIAALPTVISLYEQLLGALHPDVVAAKAAVATFSSVHASAVAAQP
jgi:hypothetical protein